MIFLTARVFLLFLLLHLAHPVSLLGAPQLLASSTTYSCPISLPACYVIIQLTGGGGAGSSAYTGGSGASFTVGFPLGATSNAPTNFTFGLGGGAPAAVNVGGGGGASALLAGGGLLAVAAGGGARGGRTRAPMAARAGSPAARGRREQVTSHSTTALA